MHTKMLSPREVIEAAVAAYHADPEISIAQAEGLSGRFLAGVSLSVACAGLTSRSAGPRRYMVGTGWDCHLEPIQPQMPDSPETAPSEVAVPPQSTELRSAEE